MAIVGEGTDFTIYTDDKVAPYVASIADEVGDEGGAGEGGAGEAGMEEA